MIFSSLKSLAIPEGSVKRITQDGTVLWEKPASYINLAQPNDDNTTDFTIWINKARMGSDGSYRSYATSMVTNLIEMVPGEISTYYFYGMDIPENGFSSSIVGTGAQVAFIASKAATGLSKGWIMGLNFADFNSKWNGYIDYAVDSNGFVTSMTMGYIWEHVEQFTTGPFYFRLALPITTDKSKIIITKDQPLG